MDECHGLLVTHEDGRVECLDDDCTQLDGPRHQWRATCTEVPGLCGCAERDRSHDRQWKAA
jgi:hypothetical protein